MNDESDLTLEDMVLIQSLADSEYSEKVFPYLKSEYFENPSNGLIHQTIDKFVKQYDKFPAVAALAINLERVPKISDKQLDAARDQLKIIEGHIREGSYWDRKFLLDETEQWCRDRAVYNIFYAGAQALQEGKQDMMSEVPTKLQEAMAISFNFKAGHDFLDNAEERYDFFHDDAARIPFKLELFNKITRGGVPLKTLTCFMSSTTGGFKSGTMADWAAFLMANGYDVLYLTMELSEEMVAQRIDANLMDMRINDIETLTKPLYMDKIAKVREKCTGRLIIKEYPTGAAHAGHFRFLLKELRSKRDFRPKIVFVDYLNICASVRMGGQAANSYTYVKSIAEELRGLAVEMDFACVTATQGNRGAIGSSDVSLADVSESIGLPATCDLFIGIISNEEMDELGQIKFKQLKNRFGDMNYYRYMTMGIDKAKMTLYDLDQSAFKVDRSANEEPGESPIAARREKGKKDFSEFQM